MNIKPQNLIEVTGAKAGQRAILKDGKAILVGIGGKQLSGGSGVDTSDTTAKSSDVLAGKVFHRADGKLVQGTIATVEPTVDGNTFTVQQGYVATQTVKQVPLANITQTEDKLIIDIGYIDQKKEYQMSSSGGSGSLDVVKVTQYSPYVPAYSAQKGYSFELEATWYNWQVDKEQAYDTTPYEGLYTVTEQTKHCTSFGRVYKNANGKWLYAFSYDNWQQATDDNSTAYWCIHDSLGYAPQEAFCSVYCNNKNTAISSLTDWSNYYGMYTFTSVVVAQQVTSPATQAIPMVLKGTKVTGYDKSTMTWQDGPIAVTPAQFDIQPRTNWYYNYTNGNLVGSAVGSAIASNLYVKFDVEKAETQTGQPISRIGDGPVFKTVQNVPCVDIQNGGGFDIFSDDFLIKNNQPFAISAFVRIDKNQYNDYILFQAYNSNWSSAGGFQFILLGSKNFFIRGGGVRNDSLNTVSTYRFPTGKWIHVFYVYDKVRQSVYINGECVWVCNITRTFPTQSVGQVAVGNSIDHRNFWDGYIAQFKYYNALVSQHQIKAQAERCLAMVNS